MNFCVITTINPPTKAIEVLHSKFDDKLIIVGDNKTPKDWEYKSAKFILPKQMLNHYSVKNDGYIEAMKQGATCIYDTDDDNIPNENWRPRGEYIQAMKSNSEDWFNAYEPMTKEFIWPRGFPLTQLKKVLSYSERENVKSSIQQGLSDGEPDVDAIWRLVFGGKHSFPYQRSLYLNRNTWCPFNSQSTWWFEDAFPLMYLPINCSFRMTDIWRSLIAQRCLWELGQGVTFHSPSEVFQERNPHNLMIDFEQEVPGYLYNEWIMDLLSKTELKPGKENVAENLFECYYSLASKGIFPKGEFSFLEKWIKDAQDAKGNLGRATDEV